jgi:hypothetical protein
MTKSNLGLGRFAVLTATSTLAGLACAPSSQDAAPPVSENGAAGAGANGGGDASAGSGADGAAGAPRGGGRDGSAGAVSDASAQADGAPTGPRCKSVAVGGGGYVTGLFAHPTASDVVYLRTDVGGFYRWEPGSQSWTPITDRFGPSQKVVFGGLALALDPADPEVVYILSGRGATGQMFKSADRGNTWVPVAFSAYVDGNADYRYAGERFSVDPYDSSILVVGTQRDGLQRSQGGSSFSQVGGVPAGSAPVGVNAIAFDPSLPGRVVAASFGQGVYLSTDHAATFSAIAGSPTDVMRIAVAKDSTLVATCESGVSRHAAGAWTKLSPTAPRGFDALAVDPTNPKHILVAANQQWTTSILRSTDGGDTFAPIKVAKHATVPWWPSAFFANAASSMLFDPSDPKRVWESDWFGVWRADDITLATTEWTALEKGHEEVVVHDLSCPSAGAELLSGVADVGGFRHDTLDGFPSHELGALDGTSVQDNYALAFDPAEPTRVFRVGGKRDGATESWGFSSSDGGDTWHAMAGAPAAKIARRIVHSAAGSRSLLVIDDDGQGWYNADGTASSWNVVAGLPQQSEASGAWVTSVRAAADGSSADTFYYVSGSTLYRMQGGNGFQSVSQAMPTPASSNKYDMVVLAAMPGLPGDLWLAVEKIGLLRLSGDFASPQSVGAFSTARALALGRPGSAGGEATVFVLGVRGGSEGLFRSTDRGATWTDVTDPDHRLGPASLLEASSQTFGRVFVGTGGRGIFVCEAP